MLVIGIGSSVIYVRYLGDQNYGIAVYITDMSIFAVTICSLGLGTYQAKILPKLKSEGNLSEYRYTLVNNIRIRLLVILVLLLLVCLLNYLGYMDVLSKYYYSKYFLIVYILLQVFLAALRGPLQVEYQQKFLNMLDISALIVRLLLVLYVIYFDFGLTGFLITEVIIEISKLTLLTNRFRQLVWVQIKNVKSTYKQGILASSLPMYLVDLSSRVFGKEYDILFLGILLGKDSFRQIAIYSLSFVLVSRSFAFLGIGTANAATILMNFSSEVIADGKTYMLVKMIEKQVKFLFLIVMPMICGGVLLGGKILQFLYGNDFTEFAILNAMFFIGYGISSISYISKPILFVIGKDKVLLKIRILLAIVKTSLLIYAVINFKMYGAAMVTAFVIAILSITEGLILKHELKLNINYNYMFKVIISNLFMSGAIIFMMHSFHNITIFRLIIIILIAVLIYCVFLLLLKPFCKEDSDMLNDIALIRKYKINKLLAFIAT